MFEVALKSAPYERVVVGKNLEYILETIRAEGTSDWYTAAHDEYALGMPIRPDFPPGNRRQKVEPMPQRGQMRMLRKRGFGVVQRCQQPHSRPRRNDVLAKLRFANPGR